MDVVVCEWVVKRFRKKVALDGRVAFLGDPGLVITLTDRISIVGRKDEMSGWKKDTE